MSSPPLPSSSSQPTAPTLSNFLYLPRATTIQDAVTFYLSTFAPHASLTSQSQSTSPNTLSRATLSIYSHPFILIEQGPSDRPSPGTSFLITCPNGQPEIDALWGRLGKDGAGEKLGCGWVRDGYGFFWQVVPTEFRELLSDEGGGGRRKRVMAALRGMGKIDVGVSKDAAAGAGAESGTEDG